MRVRSLLLATIGVMGMQTNAQAEQWSKFQCMRDCRQDTCGEEKRKEACEANCAHLDPSVLEACKTAKPQASVQPTRPTPPPRRGPSLAQQVQPSSEPSPKGDEGQDTPRGRPQGLRLSKPPVLEQEPSKVEPSENKAPKRPDQPLPTSPSQFTYTADELNHLLKGLLNDQIKEITTGCDSAMGKIHGGLEMIKVDQSADAIDLMKRGTGFIALFMKEKKDATDWVETFDVSKHLSEEDLKKYGVKKEDVNFKEKLSLDVLKKIYQKSQEKSLLVSQDCKVKSAQFQGWLEAHLAKSSSDGNAKKKTGFLRRSESKK